MKIVIASDIHGRSDLLSELISLHKSRDGLIFLGDGARDVPYHDCIEGGKFFHGVRGNCDGIFSARCEEYELSDELILRFDEYTVIVMHGHTHSVKSGIERAVVYTAERGGNVLLFGHTHVPLEKYFPEGTDIDGYILPHGVWAFNPGSLGSSADGRHRYGLMQIRRGQLLLSHGEIK